MIIETIDLTINQVVLHNIEFIEYHKFLDSENTNQEAFSNCILLQLLFKHSYENHNVIKLFIEKFSTLIFNLTCARLMNIQNGIRRGFDENDLSK